MNKQSITQLTDNKWLNLYVKDTLAGKYYFATRRSGESIGKIGVIDGVKILPYFEENGKTKVIIIKEYRYPINGYIYELPAGLVEKGENIHSAVSREFDEEVGGEVLEISEPYGGLSSAGMTDEYLNCYFVKVKPNGKQNLEVDEDISVIIIDIDDIPEIIKNEAFCMISKLMLLAFYERKRGEE